MTYFVSSETLNLAKLKLLQVNNEEVPTAVVSNFRLWYTIRHLPVETCFETCFLRITLTHILVSNITKKSLKVYSAATGQFRCIWSGGLPGQSA